MGSENTSSSASARISRVERFVFRDGGFGKGMGAEELKTIGSDSSTRDWDGLVCAAAFTGGRSKSSSEIENQGSAAEAGARGSFGVVLCRREEVS